MKAKNIEDKYLEGLVLNKTPVKVNLKDGKFFAGIILGVTEVCILFLDKFNNEVFISRDDIQRIAGMKTRPHQNLNSNTFSASGVASGKKRRQGGSS